MNSNSSCSTSSRSISGRILDSDDYVRDSCPEGSDQLPTFDVCSAALIAACIAEEGGLKRVMGRLLSSDPAVRLATATTTFSRNLQD